MIKSLQIDIQDVVFILRGVGVTLQYSLSSILFGFIIGSGLNFMRMSTYTTIRILSIAYVSVIRGTPLLIQLYIIYYCLPMLGLSLDLLWSGILAFSLNSGAYIAEIIRSGINAVDKGQSEAAYTLGVSRFYTMRDIILPQSIRYILPALVNECVNLIKESAIISVLGAADLMQRANVVSAKHYSFLEPMLIVSIIYYVLCTSISLLAGYLERRINTFK